MAHHRDKNTAVVDGAFNPFGRSACMLIPCPLPTCKPGEFNPMLGMDRCMDGSLVAKLPVGGESECAYCSLDEHCSSACPYKTRAPKNAIAGKRSEIVCKVCAGVFSGRCCNQDFGRARFKFCHHCLKWCQHLSHQCPQMISSRGSINIPGSSSLNI